MGIYDQLDREKKINDEIKRIKRLYKNLDKNKIKVIDGLVQEASFMKLTLEELRDDLLKNGHTEIYENGPQSCTRERPQSKVYATVIQRYSNVMKQLIDYIPNEEKKEEKDQLLEFLSRGKK